MTTAKIPKVSIGLPVFNGEDYLAEALDSILAQTYSDFELIISDNASTDKTAEMCAAYAARDKRIRYSRNPSNLGGAFNDNRVVELSVGNYFKWAGHDDIWKPDLLERCVQILDREPNVVLCYPKTTIIDQHGDFVEDYVDDFDLRSPEPHKRLRPVIESNRLLNPFYGLIRTDVLKKTVLVENYMSADKVLIGELALLGEFYEIPQYLFLRRVHPKKSTVANATDEERTTWFDPAAKGKILTPRTKRLIGFLRVIRRSRLSWSEQVACYLEVLRFYLSSKRISGAVRDIRQAGYTLTRKVS